MANLFDGLPGRLIAGVMAKANREAEAEAVSRLAPSPTDLVLVVGFGPGVGVKLLAERLTSGRIVGLTRRGRWCEPRRAPTGPASPRAR